MQTAKFYGASDDLIEVEGVKGGDEFPAHEDDCRKHKVGVMGRFVLGGKMRIYALYGGGGCWSFAVSQVDEGVPLPDWPIRVTQHEIRPGQPGYSAQLEIDVPDDVVLFRES